MNVFHFFMGYGIVLLAALCIIGGAAFFVIRALWRWMGRQDAKIEAKREAAKQNQAERKP